MKTSFFKAVLVFLAVFAAGCVLPQKNPAYTVARVIDGDTIELTGGQKVRYIGLDTPETRKKKGNSWVYAPDMYAEEAKEFNRKLVEGKEVRLEFDVQKKDNYDRWLAYCFVGDTFVNARILEEGYALLFTMPPNVKYVDVFIKSQQNARMNNRGLWEKTPVITPKEAGSYIGRFVTVEGKVTSVKQLAKLAILNFGTSGFKAVIFKENLSFFMADRVSLQSYKARKVRITGKIKEYKGDYEIILRHPSAIEAVD